MYACAVPEEFDYNSHTGKHGDKSQRMEVKRSCVEYIAPSEYMVSSLLYTICDCPQENMPCRAKIRNYDFGTVRMHYAPFTR